MKTFNTITTVFYYIIIHYQFKHQLKHMGAHMHKYTDKHFDPLTNAIQCLIHNLLNVYTLFVSAK